MELRKILIIVLTILLIMTSGFVLLYNREEKTMIISTTTSVENTGILYSLIDEFTKINGIVVKVIAHGSGQAVDLGRKGEVDAILVHAPGLEAEFMAGGYGENHTTLWFNYFLIAGPLDDPANISQASSASDALARIRDTGSMFYSRGDSSGTHIKELGLWDTPPSASTDEWYIETGKGMSPTLVQANEQSGYVLSDFGTYTQLQSTSSLPGLTSLYSGDKSLYNPYSYIVVSSDKYPQLNTEAAYLFLEFLQSERGIEIVNSFKSGSDILFTPIEDA